jgi:hypothetical protein
MAAQRAQFDAEEEELKLFIAQEQAALNDLRQGRDEMASSRKADESAETISDRSRRRKANGPAETTRNRSPRITPQEDTHGT